VSARLALPARLLAALALAIVGLSPAAAGPVRAADVTFGTPAATFDYGKSIAFTVPMDASVSLARLEIRLTYPGALGPFTQDVPIASGGTQKYTLVTTGGGHIVPNTAIQAVWAAIPDGGGDPILSAPVTVRYADTGQQWRTLKGDLVTVHWYEGNDAFARKALQIGDDAVKSTADLLGVTESKPIDFFIYGDQASFRDALGPGTRENVGGESHADIRTMFALITPDEINDSWVGIVVPHELTHLVFDTAVQNPYRFPPRWVNEGLAVYLSQGYDGADQAAVADAIRSKDLLPLTALTGQFPTEPDKTSLAYSEAVSAIDYLVKTYHQQALLGLISAYKAGLTDDEAFTRAIDKDVAAFQAGWLDDIGAAAPQAYGPQPNPSGPVPPGWDAPVPGAPTAAPGASPAAAASPVAASPSSGQAAQPTPTPTARPVTGSPAGSTNDGPDPLLLLAVVGVIAIVVFAMVIARRRTAVS
jgi:hypothetical protein